MTQLLVVILHDLSRLPELFKAWKEIGVPGVTLLHSMGGYQAENWLDKIGLRGLSRLLEQGEVRQRTLLSVISDEELLEKAIAAADAVVEGFDRPHSGILFTIPIGHALGIRKRGHEVTPELQLPTDKITASAINVKTSVESVLSVFDLQPVIVKTSAPLTEIIEQMLNNRNVQIACVVNEEKRLVGLIDLKSLSDVFFSKVFPEHFFGELKDLKHALEFAALSKVRIASDLMQDPFWVKREDSLEKAFDLMHEHNLPGLPVLDDHFEVIGYINLLEMMAVCLINIEDTGKNR
ncbi:MAG: CBS domain-containing protein [Chloroflexi bacterium]|nr:MAG: CBS domain-containing protein [Chloroflexota bacterium]